MLEIIFDGCNELFTLKKKTQSTEKEMKKMKNNKEDKIGL